AARQGGKARAGRRRGHALRASARGARHARDPRRARRHRAARRGARLGTAPGPAGRAGARRRPLLSPQAAHPAGTRPRSLRMSVCVTGRSVLTAHRLRKRYDKLDVVDGVDLDIAAGECFGLLGPNGAGKTTTLRLCLGLTYPDAGKIELLGEPVPARAREARQRVGVVPQFDNLDPDFTVAENLLV